MPQPSAVRGGPAQFLDHHELRQLIEQAIARFIAQSAIHAEYLEVHEKGKYKSLMQQPADAEYWYERLEEVGSPLWPLTGVLKSLAHEKRYGLRALISAVDNPVTSNLSKDRLLAGLYRSQTNLGEMMGYLIEHMDVATVLAALEETGLVPMSLEVLPGPGEESIKWLVGLQNALWGPIGRQRPDGEPTMLPRRAITKLEVLRMTAIVQQHSLLVTVAEQGVSEPYPAFVVHASPAQVETSEGGWYPVVRLDIAGLASWAPFKSHWGSQPYLPAYDYLLLRLVGRWNKAEYQQSGLEKPQHYEHYYPHKWGRV